MNGKNAFQESGCQIPDRAQDYGLGELTESTVASNKPKNRGKETGMRDPLCTTEAPA
jgi:hypothetical protein